MGDERRRIRYGRSLAIGLGVAACLMILLLFFPLGCFESDSAPGTGGRQRGECPGNLTRIGLEWPNGWSGAVGAVALSQSVGWSVGIAAWRRWADSSVRRAEDLRW